MFSAKRLGKELQKAKERLPPGIELVKADDFQEWQVDITVLDENPLYQDQIYRLRFNFNKNYPIQAPEVSFMLIPPSAMSNQPLFPPRSSIVPTAGEAPTATAAATPLPTARPVPIHPHIYSNGIICLDLLGSAWSPVQSVESVCVSIQSMLTGNTKNERPPGDEDFCRSMAGPGRRTIRDVSFIYDDATV